MSPSSTVMSSAGSPISEARIWAKVVACPWPWLMVPSRAIVHAVHRDLHAQGVGHRLQGPPKADFSEQVYEHDLIAAADGLTAAALINPALRGGFGIRLDYDRAALPCLIEWQCLQSGLYVLGIERSYLSE